jgi:hypothetical protein
MLKAGEPIVFCSCCNDTIGPLHSSENDEICGLLSFSFRAIIFSFNRQFASDHRTIALPSSANDEICRLLSFSLRAIIFSFNRQFNRQFASDFRAIIVFLTDYYFFLLNRQFNRHNSLRFAAGMKKFKGPMTTGIEPRLLHR